MFMEKLPIFDRDPWLENYRSKIEERHGRFQSLLSSYGGSTASLAACANGYMYFGFTYDAVHGGWWFREWLPGASQVTIFGDFNDWNRWQLPLYRRMDGVWEIFISNEMFPGGIRHEMLFKLCVVGDNGTNDRISPYACRVVQDDGTKNFTAQMWLPGNPFDWGEANFEFDKSQPLLIYECHVGMAQEREGVGSYTEFAEIVLPRIKALGYNALQLMAVAEHPYYGSFGYHVSSLFAPSSRFGTPEQLKILIRTAHEMGIAVIMDIVHSHFVKNVNEGINELDGTDHLYSPAGEAGNQPHWDSKNYDYTKPQVRHFLLSNLKYWLTEFHFDGFRFDGVTSMLYKHFGYTEFDDPDKYFNDDINLPAIDYLTLANALIHEINPSAITIAEDVSGMPAMTAPIDEGGIGFDYRLGMAIPDFWIEMLEDIPDEQWDIHRMWAIMTDRLPYVRTIAYAESHDQALVGDKTIAFRLMGKDMYSDMDRVSINLLVDRGIALHKMIRLFTLTLGGQGYLNFMGNEFGHPDWIDFPREGNGWSYAYARRQWSLADNPFLRYGLLQAFDRDMITFVRQSGVLEMGYGYRLQMDEVNNTIVFSHGNDVFVFNWHTDNAIPDYEFAVREAGEYRVVLSTDDKKYGGLGRIDKSVSAYTQTRGDGQHVLKVYNINRTAMILSKK